VPGLRLVIVGAEPSRAIVALGAAPGVTVTGSVKDVRPHVTRAALSVAPLTIARGTQNKILESMAMGVPVIASTVASRGVDARPGEDLLVADTVEEWCTAVACVLEDPDQRARLAAAGRNRVLERHSWNASMSCLDGLLQTAFDARNSRRAANEEGFSQPARR
jgi:glycosyltransferase involved in cell wall biosynthesis